MEDKYKKTPEGKYVIDTTKYTVFDIFVAITFLLAAIAIPIILLENIWFEYIPTTKSLLTCIVILVTDVIYVRYMFLETNDNGEWVIVEKYRTLNDE